MAAFFCWTSVVYTLIITQKRHFVEFFRGILAVPQNQNEQENNQNDGQEGDHEDGQEGDQEDGQEGDQEDDQEGDQEDNQENNQEGEHENHQEDDEQPVPKNINIARFYPFIFLLRRYILVIMVVALYDANHAPRMIILILFQLLIIGYVLKVRSFHNFKDHITDIFNESTYLLLIFIMSVLSSDDKWTNGGEYAFIIIILINA